VAQLERTLEQLAAIRGADVSRLACDNAQLLLAD
jgi:hypothetical protein